jgi:hypothetical protein
MLARRGNMRCLLPVIGAACGALQDLKLGARYNAWIAHLSQLSRLLRQTALRSCHGQPAHAPKPSMRPGPVPPRRQQYGPLGMPSWGLLRKSEVGGVSIMRARCRCHSRRMSCWLWRHLPVLHSCGFGLQFGASCCITLMQAFSETAAAQLSCSSASVTLSQVLPTCSSPSESYCVLYVPRPHWSRVLWPWPRFMMCGIAILAEVSRNGSRSCRKVSHHL